MFSQHEVAQHVRKIREAGTAKAVAKVNRLEAKAAKRFVARVTAKYEAEQAREAMRLAEA